MDFLRVIWIFFVLIPFDASLWYSDEENPRKDFDCFYAHFAESISKKDGTFRPTDYLTPYCRRLSSNETHEQVQGNVRNVVTFEKLREQGITSTQLLQWSIAIDTIEEYAVYLSMNDTKYDRMNFYNCSALWFGSRCQYTFDLNTTVESFGDHVLWTFDQRREFTGQILIHTCYPHLLGCSRGPDPMCLDWREICDGKIDCIGENFALDEDYCDELELTECNTDEYRCHNGGQCIPLEFFQDGWLSKDCLDGTDERFDNEVIKIEDPFNVFVSVDCLVTSTFVCEEKTCRNPRTFSCGDGTCVKLSCLDDPLCLIYPSFPYIEMLPNSCPSTGRDLAYSRSIRARTRDLLGDCSKFLACKIKFYEDILFNDEECLASSCEREWIPFPAQPLFGYFQFIYWTANLSVHSRNDLILPDLICNDPRQCFDLPERSLQLGGLDCRPFQPYVTKEYWTYVYYLNDVAGQLLEQCFLRGNRMKFPLNSSSLFFCQYSQRYISKHRLLDSNSDCYFREDELIDCPFNDLAFYSCQWRHTCLLSLGIDYPLVNCKSHYDRSDLDVHENIFPHICNGISNDIRENDEMNCDFWPCYNPYTRCDDYFQCANLIDEIACSKYNCRANELKCNDLDGSENYHCISHDNIYEKSRMSCFKTRPNLRFPRNLFYAINFTNPTSEYLSWTNRTCLTTADLCADEPAGNQLVCPMIETNIFANNILEMKNITDEQVFCRLTSTSEPDRVPRKYFSTLHLGDYSPINKTVAPPLVNNTRVKNMDRRTSVEYCHRGIVIYEGQSYTKRCLCPPSYFGQRCQWQNQRISLTFRFRQLLSFETKDFFYELLIYLIDDQEGRIENYERISFIPSRDCEKKFDRYLLYPTRPKSTNNYSIRVDLYDKMRLEYYASWDFPIRFSFLPVHRLSTLLIIPVNISHPSINCSLDCGMHGQCLNYLNSPRSFCRCDEGYSGRLCDVKHSCSCSSDSLCLNTSICLCPLHKFGSKCYLKHSSCQPNNPCQNNGQCLPVDARINTHDSLCLCNENSMGLNCEYPSNRIDIHFQTRIIPEMIYAHWITGFDDRKHERWSTLKKLPFNRQSITLFTKQTFHLLFIEYLSEIYRTVVRERFLPSEWISMNITAQNRCVNITQLLNSTISNLSYFDQIKFYQLPCLENLQLTCFYDQQHLCICDENRFSNCFDFLHNQTYDCQGRNPCENNGTCFQDTSNCPKIFLCMCKKCYYGSQCELTTNDFSLSLDVIFGYQIQSSIGFNQQSIAVKITATMTTLMLVVGLLSGIFSVVTFRRKSLLDVGCGVYLLINSNLSLLTIIIFTMKFWALVLFQMNTITNRSLIYFNCLLIDMILKVLLSANDWLNASVASERAFTALKGIHFNKLKSKSLSKRVIPILLIVIVVSYLHDPFSRELYDDKDEERTWCIVKYSSQWKVYDRFLNIFHFLTPFVLNIISALIIILQVFRMRSKLQPKLTRRTFLHAEIKRHKHLLISPFILILLALPRLIISFLPGCMESPHNPWLYLIGYYISFVPPLLIFIVFVLPSEKYRDEFIAWTRERRLS